jgi:hypothetical protein
VGVILNHILNHVLKKYFAEPRPMFRDVVFEAGFPPLAREITVTANRSTHRCGSLTGLSRIWWAGRVRIPKKLFWTKPFFRINSNFSVIYTSSLNRFWLATKNTGVF